jgi:hypothetical protein
MTFIVAIVPVLVGPNGGKSIGRYCLLYSSEISNLTLERTSTDALPFIKIMRFHCISWVSLTSIIYQEIWKNYIPIIHEYMQDKCDFNSLYNKL